MTEGHIKFSFLIAAGFLGIFFKIGLVSLWGLFLGILIAIIGPMAVSIYSSRARRKRNEQAMAVLAISLLKKAEGSHPTEKAGALDA